MGLALTHVITLNRIHDVGVPFFCQPILDDSSLDTVVISPPLVLDISFGVACYILRLGHVFLCGHLLVPKYPKPSLRVPAVAGPNQECLMQS